jgi:hypothetical protein
MQAASVACKNRSLRNRSECRVECGDREDRHTQLCTRLEPKNGTRQRVLHAMPAPLPFMAADVIRPLHREAEAEERL